MATKAAEKPVEIEILALNKARVVVQIVGKTPLIINRQSEKTMRTLLLPGGKKSAAEKQSTMKHDPFVEFQASPYLLPSPSAQTLIAGLSAWFKQAMCSAAVDLPGTSKAQIGRLVWIEGERIAIYGEPQLFMAGTRSAGIDHSPDVRTRVILPRWACTITIRHTVPLLRTRPVMHLLGAAGDIAGVGDWRPQKGSGNYGSFEVVTPETEAEYADITSTWGRRAQIVALQSPRFYDEESEELYTWWQDEAADRGFTITTDPNRYLTFHEDGSFTRNLALRRLDPSCMDVGTNYGEAYSDDPRE